MQEQLTEASLSRIMSHLDSGASWGIVSAWRGEDSQEVKNAQTEQLKKDLKRLRHGFFKMKGKWEETNRETNEKEVLEERSFFVIGITRSEIVSLCRRYHQEAVVFGEPSDGNLQRPEKGPMVLVLGPSNQVLEIHGPNESETMRPMQVAKVYSEYKGRPFKLGESVVLPPPLPSEESIMAENKMHDRIWSAVKRR